MKLTVCIASRGRPDALLRVIESIDSRIVETDNTTISVALDEDDDRLPQRPETRCKLVWSIERREDSLGEKYNRAQAAAPADWYVMGADDNLFITEGWDRVLRVHAAQYGDQPGFVYFGRLDGALPTQMAVPHSMVELQGFMFPPYWPFWFHDTWTDEIAHMCGRIIWAPIQIQEIGGRGQTRGLREVTYWAKLFEALRPIREEIADRISLAANPPWLRMQLAQKRDILKAHLEMRNSPLTNPATAVVFQQRMSFDAPKDDRYDRIKSRAEFILQQLRESA